jgi:hypothetical protein
MGIVEEVVEWFVCRIEVIGMALLDWADDYRRKEFSTAWDEWNDECYERHMFGHPTGPRGYDGRKTRHPVPKTWTKPNAPIIKEWAEFTGGRGCGITEDGTEYTYAINKHFMDEDEEETDV